MRHHAMSRAAARRLKARQSVARSHARDRSRSLPGLEALEDRIVMTTLSATQVGTLEQGLQQLATLGTQLAASGALAAPLPLVTVSVGQATQFGGVLYDSLYLPARTYLDTATDPTVEGLVAALAAQPAIGNTIASSFPAGAIAFGLTLSTAATATESLDLGAGAGTLGLSIAGDVPLVVGGTFRLPLTFNLSTTDGSFFVTPTAATAGVSVQAAGLNFGVGLGSQADLSVVGGSVDLDAQVTLGLNDPDGDGRLTSAELSGTPLTQLVTISAQGSADASLPLSASLAGYESLNLGTPVVFARQGNLLGGAAPDLSVSFGLGATAGQAIAGQIQSLLDQVAGLGSIFGSSPLVTSAVPFVGSSLADLLPTSVSGGSIFALGADATTYLQNPDATLDGLVRTLINSVVGSAGSGAQGSQASGPVSISGGLVPGQTKLQLDVQIAPEYTRAITGTLPGNPLGITGGGTGSIDVGLQAGLQFAIDLSGLAGGGALQASDASVTVEPIVMTAAATDLDLSVAVPLPGGGPAQTLGVAGGSLALTGQIGLAAQGNTPAVLTLADLEAGGLSGLLTATATGSVTASLPLDGSLDGYSTAVFGSPTVNLIAGSLPAFLHPDLNLDVQLNSAQLATALQTLLTSVANLGGSTQSSGPLAANLAVLNTDLARLLAEVLPEGVDLKDFFDYTALNASTLAAGNLASLNTATLRQALVNQAATSLGFSASDSLLGGALRVTAGLNPATQQLTARLVFAPDLGTATESSFTPDLGSAATAIGLALSGSLALGVDLDLGLDLTVGLNLADFLAGGSVSAADAFVRVDQLQVQASGSADLNLGASVGFLQASVQGGSLVFGAGAGYTVSAATPSTIATLADGGFALPALAAGTSQPGPAGGAWAFAGTSGIAAAGAAILSGNPAPPEGSQLAYLQGTGSLSQTITVAAPWAGVVRFRAAQLAAAGAGGGAEVVQLQVDGMPAGTFQPDSIVFGDYASIPLTLTAGSHTIAFVGQTAGTGTGVLLDAVGLYDTQINGSELGAGGAAPVLRRIPAASTVDAPDLTLMLPLAVNLPAGLTGLPSSATVTLTDADLADGHLPQLDPGSLASLGDLSNFRHVSPAQMIGMARTLARFLERYAASSHLDFSVPFAGTTSIGQALGISSSISNRLVNSLLAPIVGSSTSGPTFQFLDEYISQINQVLQPLGGMVTPSYDAATASLRLAFNYKDSDLPDIADQLTLEEQLGPVGSVSASATLTITPTVTANFTLGVGLSPAALAAGSVQLAPNIQTNVPVNGQLSADALFVLIVGTTAYPVLVPASSTQDNQSIADLRGDVQAALGQAGITQVMVDVGNALITTTMTTGTDAAATTTSTYQFLTFSPNPSPGGGLAADFLRIETTDGDPTITQLGFQSGQQTLGRSASLFLDDADLRGSVTLSADFDAKANLGPLGLGGKGSIGGSFGVDLSLGDFGGTTAGTLVNLSALMANLDEFSVSGVGVSCSNGAGFQIVFPTPPSGSSDPLGGVRLGMSVRGAGLPEGLRVAAIDVANRVVLLAGQVSSGLNLNLKGNPALVVTFSALDNITLKPSFLSSINASIGSIQLGGGDLPDFALPSPGQISLGVPNLKAAFGSFFPTDIKGNPLSSGVLDHDFQFHFGTGSGKPTTVTVPKESTSGNTSLADLVGSFNAYFRSKNLGGSIQAIHSLLQLPSLSQSIPAGARSIQFPSGTDLTGLAIGHLVSGVGLPGGLTVAGIDLANLRVTFNQGLPALGSLPDLSFEGISFGTGPSLPSGSALSLDGLTRVFTSGLDSIAGFRNLSFADILEGLDQVAIALGNTSSFSFLTHPLPLLDKSVVDLLNPGALLGLSSSSLNPNKVAPPAIGSQALTFSPNGPRQYVPLPDDLIPGLVVALPQPVSGLLDGGFEAPVLAPGAIVNNIPGSAWTFAGDAGQTTGNSPFTSGNPAPPEGKQVAFLQATGSMTQTVMGYQADTPYMLQFQAAQRMNYGQFIPNRQNFEVLVNGAVVGTFQPTSGSYQAYSTQPFTLDAGSNTITIQGLDAPGLDNTVFLDALQIVPAGGLTLETRFRTATVPVPDGGFEQPALGAGSFQYSAPGSPWSFTNGAGVSTAGSRFTSDNPAPPHGLQVAFVQGGGTLSQSLSGLEANTSYILSFLAAQRGIAGQAAPNQQNFRVSIDDQVIGTFQPTSTSFASFVTQPFIVNGGTHTLTIHGLNSAGGDNTVFLDDLTISAVGGVLFGYQDVEPLGAAATEYAPAIYVGLDGTLQGGIYGGQFPDLSGPFVADGQWHHAAFVQQGDQQLLYLDGQLVGTSITNPQVFSGPDQIGTGFTTQWPDASPGWSTFSGQMEEARVWSDARSQSQIRSLMNGFVTGAESGLEYWTGSLFDTSSVPTLGSGGQAVAQTPGFQPPTFSFDSTTQILDLSVGYLAAPTPNPLSLPLNIDLQELASSLTGGLPPALAGISRLLDVSGSTLLELALNADLNLHLGFDLSDPLDPELFFYSDTGVFVAGSLTADDLQFRVQAGPLAFGIGNGNNVFGSAGLNLTGSVGLYDRTQPQPGTAPTPPTQPRSTTPPTRIDLENVGVTDSIGGSASACLPVFLDDSLPALTPDLSLTVPDLFALAQGNPGSVTIATPNLNQVSSILDLLLNPSLLVTGMDGVFNGLQGFLDSNLISQSLPFVGSTLSGAIDGNGLSARVFDPVFRNNVTAALQGYIAHEASTPPTTPQLQADLTGALGQFTPVFGTVSPNASATLSLASDAWQGIPGWSLGTNNVSGSTNLTLPYAIPTTYSVSVQTEGSGAFQELTITPQGGEPLSLTDLQYITVPGFLANVQSATISGSAIVFDGTVLSAIVTVSAPDYTIPQYTSALAALTSSVTDDLYSPNLYAYTFQTDTFGQGSLVSSLAAQVVNYPYGFTMARDGFHSAYMAAALDLGTLKQWLSQYVADLVALPGLPSSVQADVQSFQATLLSNPLSSDGLSVSIAVQTALTQLNADLNAVPAPQQGQFQDTLDSLGNLAQLYARATLNAMDASQSSTLSDFLQAVFDLFGPKVPGGTNAGLGILLDPATSTPYSFNGNGQILDGSGAVVTLAQAVPLSLPDNNGIEFDLLLGQSLDLALATDALDLSLPGLGLNLGGTTVDVGMDWTLEFGFGLSLSDGFYLVTGSGPEFNARLTFGVDQGTPLGAQLGFLTASADIQQASFAADFSLDLTDTNPQGVPGWLSVTDLVHGDVGVAAGLSGQANLDVDLTVGFGQPEGTPSYLPSYTTTLLMGWGYSGQSAIAGGPDVVSTFKFTDVGLELGDYVANFLYPVVEKIHAAIGSGPVGDFLNLIQEPLPVISQLSGSSVTLMSLAQELGTLDPATAQFINDADILIKLFESLDGVDLSSLASYPIDFGDIDLTGSGFSIQKLHAGSVSLPSLSYRISRPALSFSTQLGAAGSIPAATFVSNFNKVQGSLSLPILNDPTSAFGILMGRSVELFGYTMPALQFNFSYSQQFPIFPPLYANVGGSLSARAQFAFGYDTYGLTEYAQGGFSTPLDVFDGFYINTDQSFIRLGGALDAGADINLAVASAGVDGGIGAQITLGLADPEGDGRLRYKDIVSIIDGQGGSDPDDFLDLFSLDGSVTASLYAYISVDIGFTIFGHHFCLICYSDSWNIVPPQNLWSITEGASAQSVRATADEPPDVTAAVTSTPPEITAPLTPLARVGTSLGQLDGGVLRLNVGPRARYFRPGHSSDGDESVTISHLGGEAGAETLLVSGMGTSQVFAGVGSIVADFGLGTNDLLVESGVLAAAEIRGGRGQNTFTIEGSGPARLEAGPGPDTLIGGTGPTTFVAGTGHNRIVSRGGADTVVLGSGTYEVSGNSSTVVEVRDQHAFDLSDAALIVDQRTSTLSGVGLVRLLGNAATSTVRVHDWSGHAVIDSGPGQMQLDIELGGGGQVDLQGAIGHHVVQVESAPRALPVLVAADSIAQGTDQVRFLDRDRVHLTLVQPAGGGDVRFDGLPGQSVQFVSQSATGRVAVGGLQGGEVLTIRSARGANVLVDGLLASRSSVEIVGAAPASLRAATPSALNGTIVVRSPASRVQVEIGGDLAGRIGAVGAGSTALGRVVGSITSTGALNAATVDRLRVGGDLAGSVQAGRRLGVLEVAGRLSGTVTAGALETLQLGGDLAGSVAATGAVRSVRVGGSITGTVRAGSIEQTEIRGSLLGGTLLADRLDTVRIGGEQAGRIPGARVGMLAVGGSSWTPLDVASIESLAVGGNLAGPVTASGRIGRVEVAGSAAGAITAADVGLVVARNAEGPRVLQVREAGITRQVVTVPAGPGPRFEAVYDSTGRGTPQVSLHVKNPAAAAFDLRLEASSGASVDLGRLDAAGRSGVRNLFVQGDITGGLAEGARVALALPKAATGGVQLPRERLGAVEAHGRLGARALRVRGLEQLALERYTTARGRIVAAGLAPTRYARFAVAPGTRFLKSSGPAPVQPGRRPLAVLYSTRHLPALVPNRRLVIPAR